MVTVFMFSCMPVTNAVSPSWSLAQLPEHTMVLLCVLGYSLEFVPVMQKELCMYLGALWVRAVFEWHHSKLMVMTRLV
jgi:hypothetical protein